MLHIDVWSLNELKSCGAALYSALHLNEMLQHYGR